MQNLIPSDPGRRGSARRGAWPLLAGLLLLPLFAQAQVPSWQDAFGTSSQPSGGTSDARATATDAAGNMYVTGTFNGVVIFGNSTLTSVGSSDVFAAKWDVATSTWAWAVSGGGTASDASTGIAVDGSGNVYITGSVYNKATSATNLASAMGVQFGGQGLNNAANNTNQEQDMFVAKYSASGAYQWARSGGGTSYDYGQGIAVDGSGNVYVTGYVNNRATSATDLASAMGVQFGGQALNSAANNISQNPDVFLVKYSTAGAYQWARAGGGTSYDGGQGVAVDGSGNVYVTGYVYNKATSATDPTTAMGVQFGGQALNSATNSTSENQDVFVAKYTSSGAYQWAVSGGGNQSDQANAIAVDASGNVYVTGSVLNKATSSTNLASAMGVQFGGQGLNNAANNTSQNNDVYVAKYSTTGVYQWAVSGGGTGDDASSGIAVDGSGNAYLSGYVVTRATSSTDLTSANAVQFGGQALNSATNNTSTNIFQNRDVFVASYNASGTYQWATSGGSTLGDFGYGISVNGNTLAVALAVSNPGSFGGQFAPAGVALLGTISTSGTWQRVYYPLQSGNAQVRAVATDAAGNVFVAGSYTGQLLLGSAMLFSAGGNDAFVAKWDGTTHAWGWVASGGGTASDVSTGIAVDASGSVYISGTVSNAATTSSNLASGNGVQFGGVGLNSASNNTGQNNDVFLAKYSASGAYQWAVSGGGYQGDQANAIAVDASGNVYVTGSVYNAATTSSNLASVYGVQFGGVGLNSASNNTSQNNDVFVAKYSTTGAYQWAVSGGGTGDDQANGIAVDAGGNAYLTGYVSNKATSTSNLATALGVQFGGQALNSTTNYAYQNYDVFVAKYNTAGAYQWAQAGGGSGYDYGQAIAVDAGGNAYLTGYVSNKATSTSNLASGNGVQFGGVVLNSASDVSFENNDVFVAKYSTTGTYQWAVSGGGNQGDQANAIAVDASGSAYVTGFVGTTASSSTDLTSTWKVQFGGQPLPSATYTVGTNNDVFVVKYNDSGVYQWARPAGGAGYDQGTGIALDGRSNVYVVGQATPPATFGSLILANPAGVQSPFVARLGLPLLTSTAAELPGQAVQLTGSGFSSSSTVSFNGVAGSVVYVSPTVLTTVVPVGALVGAGAISVSTGGTTLSTSATAFEVLQVYRGTAASGCLNTANVSIGGTGGAGVWRYLRLPGVGGAVVAAIEDTRNLGTVSAGITALGTGTGAAVRKDSKGRAYLDRNFTLTATNKTFTGQTVRVRFFGLASELSRLQLADANAVTRLNASQYSGPNEDCDLSNNSATGEKRVLATVVTTATGADWFTAELPVADHFSEFYLTGSSTPLPVELLTFAATLAPQQPAVGLAWTTASEKNSARFEVERSTDGAAFATLGSVAAAGSSSAPRGYAFTDASLPTLQARLYYRLRQVDADGTFSYSPVRTVALEARAAQALTLAPNPARTTTLSGAQAGAVVQVFDALGRLVVTATADGRGTAQVALPAALPTGVYVVRSGLHAVRLVVD